MKKKWPMKKKKKKTKEMVDEKEIVNGKIVEEK